MCETNSMYEAIFVFGSIVAYIAFVVGAIAWSVRDSKRRLP
jgi:hypothetical protein